MGRDLQAISPFTLGGQMFPCTDSNVTHDWTFTPVISLAVTSATEEETSRLAAALAQDGQVVMPLDTYPCARWFA